VTRGRFTRLPSAFAVLGMTLVSTTQAPADLSDLPIQEFPAARAGPTLAVLLTGDGGFAEFDRQLAASLAERGVAVVGLNSRAYFGTARTPDQAAHDVARIMLAYLARWQRQQLVLIGYSRGADAAPFIVNRLPEDLRRRLGLVVMVGLAPYANFHFHLIDLVRDSHRADDLPVGPELERLRGLRMLCLHGSNEIKSGCRDADSTLMQRHEHRGGHRVTADFEAITELIVAAIPSES